MYWYMLLLDCILYIVYIASEKEQLRMSVTTGAKISAFSFNNQAGILSGPEALVGLRDASFR